MCGRFTRNYTWRQIHALYRLMSPASNLQPRFNICPTTDVDAVILGDGQRVLIPMRWGIIPGWWTKPLKEMRLATFNARAETVAQKPLKGVAFNTAISITLSWSRQGARQLAPLFTVGSPS